MISKWSGSLPNAMDDEPSAGARKPMTNPAINKNMLFRASSIESEQPPRSLPSTSAAGTPTSAPTSAFRRWPLPGSSDDPRGNQRSLAEKRGTFVRWHSEMGPDPGQQRPKRQLPQIPPIRRQASLISTDQTGGHSRSYFRSISSASPANPGGVRTELATINSASYDSNESASATDLHGFL